MDSVERTGIGTGTGAGTETGLGLVLKLELQIGDCGLRIKTGFGYGTVAYLFRIDPFGNIHNLNAHESRRNNNRQEEGGRGEGGRTRRRGTTLTTTTTSSQPKSCINSRAPHWQNLKSQLRPVEDWEMGDARWAMEERTR